MSGFKFSNFQPSPMTLRGTTWSTVEHFYQAMKSEDPAEQRKVRKLETPGQAKRAGRKVKMRKDWGKVKESIMMEALRAKFSTPASSQVATQYPHGAPTGRFGNKCSSVKRGPLQGDEKRTGLNRSRVVAHSRNGMFQAPGHSR